MEKSVKCFLCQLDVDAKNVCSHCENAFFCCQDHFNVHRGSIKTGKGIVKGNNNDLLVGCIIQFNADAFEAYCMQCEIIPNLDSEKILILMVNHGTDNKLTFNFWKILLLTYLMSSTVQRNESVAVINFVIRTLN